MPHELADQFAPKWGRPKIVNQRAFDIFDYKCERCNASWVGPMGECCDWCHQRWVTNQASERHRLLFPEWMNWGERYFACDAKSRTVWAESRGFHGDFEGNWKRSLGLAREKHLVTGPEAVQALKRFELWTIHTRKFVN